MVERGMTSLDCVVCHMSDQALLAAARTAAMRERSATARLIALLMEVDARRLYLGEGYSSLFTYCTRELQLVGTRRLRPDPGGANGAAISTCAGDVGERRCHSDDGLPLGTALDG